MKSFQYADAAVEQGINIRFRDPKQAEVMEVQDTLGKIADWMGHDLRMEGPPPKGFLIKELTEQQRNLLNAVLGLQYARRNAEQQAELRNVPLVESGEQMVDLREHLQSGSQVSFSDKPFHEACGSYAKKKRIMCVRQEVATKLMLVCRALNEVHMSAHIEDCWRPPEVQQGLLLRRLVDVARANPDWNWEQVKMVAMSLTAPSPGLAGHQAGAAVDWRIYDIDGRDFLPLGNDYPEGGAHSSLEFPYLTAQQWRTRTLFASVMRMQGFRLLLTEDWHASHGDRGMGADGALTRKAHFGPLQSFNVQTEEVLAYEPQEREIPYFTDDEVQELILRARLPGGGRGKFASKPTEIYAWFWHKKSEKKAD